MCRRESQSQRLTDEWWRMSCSERLLKLQSYAWSLIESRHQLVWSLVTWSSVSCWLWDSVINSVINKTLVSWDMKWKSFISILAGKTSLVDTMLYRQDTFCRQCLTVWYYMALSPLSLGHWGLCMSWCGVIQSCFLSQTLLHCVVCSLIY